MILIDGHPYDVMISGELSFESETTDNPVEVGGDVTDHIRPLPIELSIESIVSDTPIGEIANHESRRVDEVTAEFGSPLPSEDAYERLLDIRDSRRVVVVEIPRGRGRKVLPNMALTNLTIREDKETGGGLHFNATFKQINFVTNRRVTVRTATPAGKPKVTHKATVGTAMRTDQQVLWRMGIFPGGPYVEGHNAWAVIDVEWSDGKGGPGAKSRIFYSGDASENAPARAKQPATELNAAEISAFNKDLGRDQAAKKEAQYQRDLKAAQESDAYAQKYGVRPAHQRNLPAGLDLSRFQTPSTFTPTVP